jgi:hypothetical protein
MTEHVEGRVIPHDPNNRAKIYQDKRGLLWVTHQELLECGYINLCDFDVVYLNGKFYELQGHSDKANAWWIEEIELPEETE